jgi:ribosomal-protein-alanine N-acetyltransferase
MLANSITIRKYQASDKATLLQLLLLNTPKYFAIEEEKDLDFYLDHEIEQYFIVELNHQIVGGGGINFSTDKKTGIISWDILHPDFQGQQIGTALLQHRIKILRANPAIEKIRVRTSQLVYPFYEKAGFVLKEKITDYWAKGIDLYRMEYEL